MSNSSTISHPVQGARSMIGSSAGTTNSQAIGRRNTIPLQSTNATAASVGASGWCAASHPPNARQPSAATADIKRSPLASGSVRCDMASARQSRGSSRSIPARRGRTSRRDALQRSGIQRSRQAAGDPAMGAHIRAPAAMIRRWPCPGRCPFPRARTTRAADSRRPRPTPRPPAPATAFARDSQLASAASVAFPSIRLLISTTRLAPGATRSKTPSRGRSSTSVLFTRKSSLLRPSVALGAIGNELRIFRQRALLDDVAQHVGDSAVRKLQFVTRPA